MQFVFVICVIFHLTDAKRPHCAQEGPNSLLADLDSDEVIETIKIIKSSGKFTNDIQFPILRRQEPPKSIWQLKRVSAQRVAYVAVFDSSKNLLSGVLVDIPDGSILSNVELPSQLQPVTAREDRDASEIFKSDPRVINAFSRRVLNITFVYPEFWALGASGPSGGQRLVRAVPFYWDPSTRYYDWRPVEGLQVTIDLNKKEITKFLDNKTIPLASPRQLSSQPVKPKLKPLKISQKKGSSIRVRGQEIQWYKWRMTYSMDPIHGLQLFQIRYQADCEERLVLYKISIGEMFVPYGAGGEEWRWRAAFDAGEYGLGKLAFPLVRGQDVPENSVLLNCTEVDDDNGVPSALGGCIAAYERDTGFLYKHSDWTRTTARTDGRRGRQMVLTFIATVGNYDYAFEYIFLMDGTLHVNVRLTGILLARGMSSATNDATCLDTCTVLINEHLTAPVHQHFFNYRIDFDVDGELNYVAEVDITNDPIGPSNPDDGGFSVKKTIIKNETARDFNPERSRSWHILNAQSRNKFGTPRGYSLKPMDMGYSHLPLGSQYFPQAEFVSHPFWVTKYKDEEQAAAGNFPRTGSVGQGLPEFIKEGEPIENADLVVWYTFGLTHATRAEEWPIMNVHNAGFALVPTNFMSQNSEVPMEGECE